MTLKSKVVEFVTQRKLVGPKTGKIRRMLKTDLLRHSPLGNSFRHRQRSALANTRPGTEQMSELLSNVADFMKPAN